MFTSSPPHSLRDLLQLSNERRARSRHEGGGKKRRAQEMQTVDPTEAELGRGQIVFARTSGKRGKGSKEGRL